MRTNTSNLSSMIREFYRYSKNRLGFSKKANIKLLHDEKNAKDILGYTGNYDPETYTISLYVTGRHPIDLLRSISHELVHHWQNCNGRFDSVNSVGEGYAQNNSFLRRLEKEAYEKGNLIYRDFQDMKRKSRKEDRGMTLQEMYNKRSIIIGQKFLKETVGTVPNISNVQDSQFDNNILQQTREKLLSNVDKNDIIMSIMLKGRMGREEAMSYLQQAENDIQSSQHVDLEESLEDEYKIGSKIEKDEHNVNAEFGQKIAKDHLGEDPKYYSKLKRCGI